ncbi:MAG TPA: DUF4400 domain-containing protein [Candidatus Thiothrix moscowensis]|uniref:DUF4400 domain-containing protein n=1 Tax=unclassified Thiothrix TaxID=2636184 RepID=UPI0025CB8C8E|nr:MULTISPECIES: DUF4400 domain-containing protein [unclassified Thiothrix]HRJ52265.1 DUF4400 domain-containing protein [Candidatus Thiothrix moscowensis]HRJ92580.1 DUF4400 domain-containing protein [Candidatus Thiothrix moscowensis]
MLDKVTGILWYVKWFAIVCTLALLVDIVYVFWPYPAMRGVAVFQHNLQAESGLVASLAGAEAAAFIRKVQVWAYQPTFAWSGLHEMMRDVGKPASWQGANAYMHAFVVGNWPFLQTAHIGILLFAQRLAVLLLSAPLFLVVALAAGLDGSIAWYKRRTSVGRESGFIYHRAKHGFRHTVLGIWVLYLLPPVVVDPRWILLPSLLLVAMATRLAVGYFKKYL